MTKIQDINRLGQSIWLDFVDRPLLDSGKLQRLVEQGVSGLTSNPTIFDKAFSSGNAYDDDIRRLIGEGKTTDQIYETLAVGDIQRAADVMRPVYDRTHGADGFVSLEVSPTLANDAKGTIGEAKRLWSALNRPNVMIKVPATPAGLEAIPVLIGSGLNINVTLIFGIEQYEAVAEAYIAGLERLAQSGGDVSHTASVASFFVSRVDTLVDKKLDQLDTQTQTAPASSPKPSTLRGKIAIANAKVAYARFQHIFAGPRWDALKAKGAHVQRPLWASTGTKDPRYSDTLYVDSLIGPDTVNTVPPATLDAILDHGHPAPTLEAGVGQAKDYLTRLAALGIDLEQVTQQLLDEGVASFAKSFESLLAGLEQKRSQMEATPA